MNHSTAAHKLRKSVMFDMVVRLGRDCCFRCGDKIETASELSIEHKTPWESADDPRETFFDLDNIAFSHLKCNSLAINRYRRPGVHGTQAEYQSGCRCWECTAARRAYNKEYMRKWRAKEKDTGLTADRSSIA